MLIWLQLLRYNDIDFRTRVTEKSASPKAAVPRTSSPPLLPEPPPDVVPKMKVVPSLLQPPAQSERKTTIDVPEEPHYVEMGGQTQMRTKLGGKKFQISFTMKRFYFDSFFAGPTVKRQAPPPSNVPARAATYQTMVAVDSRFEASEAAKRGNAAAMMAPAGGKAPAPSMAPAYIESVAPAPAPAPGYFKTPSMAPAVPAPSMAPPAVTATAPFVLATSPNASLKKKGTPTLAPRTIAPALPKKAPVASMAYG